jgi:hypothetical protein
MMSNVGQSKRPTEQIVWVKTVDKGTSYEVYILQPILLGTVENPGLRKWVMTSGDVLDNRYSVEHALKENYYKSRREAGDPEANKASRLAETYHRWVGDVNPADFAKKLDGLVALGMAVSRTAALEQYLKSQVATRGVQLDNMEATLLDLIEVVGAGG